MKNRISRALPTGAGVKDSAAAVAIEQLAAILRDMLGHGKPESRVLFVEDLREAGSVGLDSDRRIFAKTPRSRIGLTDQAANDAFGSDPTTGAWVSAVFDATGGLAIGSYSLEIELPENAIVTACWFDVLEAFTSGGAATVALSIPTDHVGGLLAATAIGTGWTAGRHSGIPNGSSASTFSNKTTAARSVSAEVAVADLTAGKARIFVLYSVSE